MMRTKSSVLQFIILILLFGCSGDSAKKHYLLAEKLWSLKKYDAAISEFDKVYKKDPSGSLGLQALFRSAMTASIFSHKDEEALRKFKDYVDKTDDSKGSWAAQKQIGEILFLNLRNYKESAEHYKTLLSLGPSQKESLEFRFRLAKSHFFLWKFDEAIEEYKKIISQSPRSQWGERASYEIGISLFTGGDQTPGGSGPGMKLYRQSIEAFRGFIREYPTSQYVPEAKFGIASCYEELDELDKAYQQYSQIKQSYPSPNVIQIKLARIRQRMDQRKQ